ncbi:hypothetical protein ACIP8U_35000 [Streptomyces pseudovenezuelae]|uniref:hypothetical protein n=1 Tax=Streptomyces pseudovenezuelae TaxID=67350 RepID=UPI0038042F50
MSRGNGNPSFGARYIGGLIGATNNTNQSIAAGRDESHVRQSVSPQAVDEVRARLMEFREALLQLQPSDNLEVGLRAADRIERALEGSMDQRDTIEGAADTISVMGRSIAPLAGAATAVHQAVASLWA